MTLDADSAPGMTVVVVDDSLVQRRFLRLALADVPGCVVVGEARNGREAVALVQRLRPKVVLMDLDLPHMSGQDAIEQIMATAPTPIVVTSAYIADGSQTGADALQAGAIDLIAKPAVGDRQALDDYADQVRALVKVASRARVITHPRARLAAKLGHATPRPRAPLSEVAPVAAAVAATAAERSRTPAVPRISTGEQNHVRLVVVGSSTGGPAALVSLLSGLPSDLPVPVLVVQHMSPGFVTGLASWLDEQVAMPVRVGRSFCQLDPGTVTLAPDGENTTMDALLRVRLREPAPGQLHVPSVDATFQSAATMLGPMAIGVLLTGMGRDGAAGLKAMHATGAHTIAQDEASSVVWGMPGQAVSLGAAVEILPLDEIAASIVAVIEEGES